MKASNSLGMETISCVVRIAKLPRDKSGVRRILRQDLRCGIPHHVDFLAKTKIVGRLLEIVFVDTLLITKCRGEAQSAPTVDIVFYLSLCEETHHLPPKAVLIA